MSAFSLGVHAAAQIIVDYFGRSALADSDLKLLLFGLDEVFGHIFFVFMPILFWLLMTLEHSREKIQLTAFNNTLLKIIAIIAGLFWTISGLEGGSMYLLVIPLSLFIAWQTSRKFGWREMTKYPLSRHYLISLMVMTLTTLTWVAVFRWFDQPKAAGLHLFDF